MFAGGALGGTGHAFASHGMMALAPLVPTAPVAPMKIDDGPFVGLIMSLGAGFYEELAFRVMLFGLGAKLLVWIFAHERYGVVADNLPGQQRRGLTWRALIVMLLWSIVAAAIFSGIHYVGALSDSFQLTSFVFRMVLGLVLTAIFVFRGFAAAVWAHALYDVWVLVFPLF
jgi:magnesium-transporting ATPase (P-type)